MGPYHMSMIDDDRHLKSLSLVCKQFLSISNLHKHTLNISNPTAHFLPSLLRRFPNLKHLSFSEFSGDPSYVLLQIADFNFRLESLNLSNQKRFPGEALKLFPPSILSGVKSLNLSWLSSLTDVDLEMIPSFFPTLEELDLSLPYYYCDHDFRGYRLQRHVSRSGRVIEMPTADGISILSLKLKGLRSINLGGNSRFSDNVLVSLSENCPNLEEILFKKSINVTQTGVGFALRSCPKLKSLGLFGDHHAMDGICEPLCCSLRLTKIDFRDVSVSDALLCALAEARLPLKSFTLSHCIDGRRLLTYNGILSFVKAYRSLCYLSLEGTRVLSDLHIAVFAKYLINVRVVKLNRCADLSDSTLFTLIKRCPLLETVEMKHTYIGAVKELGASELSYQIKFLNLSFNTRMLNKTLRKIALACPNLETLKVGSCPHISKKGVGIVLRNCGQLKFLQIDRCPLVDNLELGANITKLEFLIAASTSLDDEALIDVSKKCPHLMCLNIEDCTTLTSIGVIEVVDKCTKLKEINLKGCKNVSSCILPWMVFCNPNLRKIVPPECLDNSQKNLYLRHGCYVME